MSRCAALNSNMRRYIANRPCPAMQGQDQHLRDQLFKVLRNQDRFTGLGHCDEHMSCHH